MKSLKFLMAFFLVVGLGSCSDDNEDPIGTEEGKRIVGEWKILSLTIDGEEIPFTECEAQSRITFSANGTITSTDYFEDFETEECISEVSNEKWEYRGNNIYRITDGSDSVDIPILFSNNNNRFSFTEEDETGTYTAVYVRV